MVAADAGAVEAMLHAFEGKGKVTLLTMFSHADIWRALDALARAHGLSASGLARRAGLDPTSFNRSKRITANGRPRWPSTESLSKVLSCTGTTLEEFARILQRKKPLRLHVPLIGMARAGAEGYFDDAGFPAGGGWDEVEVPGIDDENAYALRIAGDSMEPVYRDGDIIVVSPNAQTRVGDRVVVRLKSGEVMAKELRRRTAEEITLASLNPGHPDRIEPIANVIWMARILWASQ